MDRIQFYHTQDKPKVFNNQRYELKDKKSYTIDNSLKYSDSRLISKQFESLDQKVRKLETHLFSNDRRDLLDIINSNILDPRRKFMTSKEVNMAAEDVLLNKNASQAMIALVPTTQEIEGHPQRNSVEESLAKNVVKKKLFEKKNTLYINHIMTANYLKSPARNRNESSNTLNKIHKETLTEQKIATIRSIPDLTAHKKHQETLKRLEEVKILKMRKEKFKDDILGQVVKTISERPLAKMKIPPIADDKVEKELNEKRINEKISIDCKKKDTKPNTPLKPKKKIVLQKIPKKIKGKESKHSEEQPQSETLETESSKPAEVEKEEEEVKPLEIKKKKKKFVVKYKKKAPPLRMFVTAIIASIRMRLLLSRKVNLQDKIRAFIALYSPNLEERMNLFIFNSVKTAYLSISNFNDLKLDISDSGSFFKCTESEKKDKFIKLSTRLTTFFDNLIDSIHKIDLDILNYFRYLTSENSYLPKELVSLFEIQRLRFNTNGCLREMTNARKRMIIAIFMIVRVLVKNILIDNRVSSSSILNIGVRKNFKIVASVIYRTVVDYYQTYLRKIDNTLSGNLSPKVVFEDLHEQGGLSIKSDEGYLRAFNQHVQKRKSEQEEILTQLPEFSVLTGDTIEDEIAFINSSLYKKNELGNYYSMSKDFSFNLEEKFEEWGRRMLDHLNNGIVG